MSDWLDSMIESKNFSAILGRIEADDSLRGNSNKVVMVVYTEIADPDGDIDFCLLILQAMLDKGWHWARRKSEIHLLLPLHRRLIKLDVSPIDRNQYYRSADCVAAAIDRGDGLTMADLEAVIRPR